VLRVLGRRDRPPVPRARGGNDNLGNLRVHRRAHNGLQAEECFGKEHVEARITLRRRSWDADGAERARRGLVGLGFKARDAARAIERVAARHTEDAEPLPEAEILREALAALT